MTAVAAFVVGVLTATAWATSSSHPSVFRSPSGYQVTVEKGRLWLWKPPVRTAFHSFYRPLSPTIVMLRETLVEVRLSTVLLACGIAAMVRPIYRAWQNGRRGPPGLCAGCGYDLRATPGRCPECGRPPDVAPDEQRGTTC
jgi:hypothetical protein